MVGSALITRILRVEALWKPRHPEHTPAAARGTSPKWKTSPTTARGPTVENRSSGPTGPGRRQAFCTEFCRRTAQNDLWRARARLSHYEGVVQKLRIGVAAFGKTDPAEDGEEELPLSLDARHKAESAVDRAEGVLKFASRDDPLAQELRMLYKAVAPIVRSDTIAG